MMYDPTTPFSHHTHADWGRLAQPHDQSCSNEYTNDQELLVQFRPNHNQEFLDSDDSGVCSPPLWKNSPSDQPLLSHHIYSSLSPNSRVQAITRGRGNSWRWDVSEYGVSIFFQLQEKKSFASNNTGKVSPKPEVVKGTGGERDWWKKKFTGSSDSDSSRTSNNSGSSGTTESSGGSSSCRSNSGGGRKKNGCRIGCWPFFSRKKRSVE
ncbi:UNVERIFIED_CONTAM: hypothetical protein Scaly_1147900 [Sesamum calycinum]|uniref:Uncharacterized protein n=1 Tax=Sesamum calycinum TaxID=2727403 RepID=A0AAW2QMZ8_9LAMI